MKTQNDLNQFRNLNNPYTKKTPDGLKNQMDLNTVGKNGAQSPSKPVTQPDSQVSVSEEAKNKHKMEFKKPSLSDVPDTPDIPDLPKEEKIEVKENKKEEKKVEDTKKIDEKIISKKGSEKNPAIFFITGLQMFGLSDSMSSDTNEGIRKMAESVKGARLYNWNQKDQMLKDIERVHPDFPVMLIGHSLGGDTAVEIANELDSVDRGFRKVDLLVTLDAIGFNNDIIPQNVKEHINVFGEKSFMLNDGPHAPRRGDKTKATNILSPLNHSELDDAKDIQFEIISAIQNHLQNTEYYKSL